MAERDWKRGELAMVTWMSLERRVTSACIRDSDRWRFMGGGWITTDASVIDARPLIALDPENPEQMGRLAQAWLDAEHCALDNERPMTSIQLRMRAAVRTLIEPPEPTEFGTRVVDRESDEWARRRDGLWGCLTAGSSSGRNWSSLINAFGPLTVVQP